MTGASRGIGAALAQRLAAEGAAVAVTARTLDAHPHLPGTLREVEAALALVSGDPTRLTGRVAYSGPLLAELGIRPRGLDGRPL